MVTWLLFDKNIELGTVVNNKHALVNEDTEFLKGPHLPEVVQCVIGSKQLASLWRANSFKYFQFCNVKLSFKIF